MHIACNSVQCTKWIQCVCESSKMHSECGWPSTGHERTWIDTKSPTDAHSFARSFEQHTVYAVIVLFSWSVTLKCKIHFVGVSHTRLCPCAYLLVCCLPKYCMIASMIINFYISIQAICFNVQPYLPQNPWLISLIIIKYLTLSPHIIITKSISH